jgi:hypothetical protein
MNKQGCEADMNAGGSGEREDIFCVVWPVCDMLEHVLVCIDAQNRPYK